MPLFDPPATRASVPPIVLVPKSASLVTKLTAGMDELPDAAALMMGPPGSGTLPDVAALATPGNAVIAAAPMRAAAVKAVTHNRLVSIAPFAESCMHQACAAFRGRHAFEGREYRRQPHLPR